MKIYYWIHHCEWETCYYTRKSDAWAACSRANKDQMVAIPVQEGDAIAMLEERDALIQKLYREIAKLQFGE